MPSKQVKSKAGVQQFMKLHHTATGNHMPCGITQCYLPSDSGNFPAFTPVEAGTRFSDLGGMEG